jgi:hypothetical protein
MGRRAQGKGNIFSQDEIPGTEFSFFQILLEMPLKKIYVNNSPANSSCYSSV